MVDVRFLFLTSALVVTGVEGAEKESQATFDPGRQALDTVIYGPSDGGRFGTRVATGDWSGDGFDDLAISAPGVDRSSGSVFIIEGTDGPLPVEINLSDDAPFVEIASPDPGTYLGGTLFAADVIGPGGGVADGVIDLVIGCPDEQVNDGRGRVYVIAGPISPSSEPVSVDDIATISYMGSAYRDRLGASFAAADLDGDGFDDLVIGAPGARRSVVDSTGVGAVYMLQAPLDTGDLVSAAEAAHVTIRGESQWDRCGTAIAAVEWPLIDGAPGVDLAVSAPGAGNDRGWVAIIDGGASAGQFQSPGVLDLSNADLLIEGGDRHVGLGRALDAGDVDGDDLSDLVLTVGPGASRGGVRVIENPGTAFADPVVGIDDEGIASVVITDGLADSDSAQYALHVRQHHPFDHRLWQSGADIFYGHGYAEPNDLEGSGAASLIPGRSEYDASDPYRATLSSAFHLEMVGRDPGDHMGTDLASADLTRDDRPEFVVGAPGTRNDDFDEPGAVWIVAGGAPYAWDHDPEPDATEVPWDHQTSIRFYDDVVTGGTDVRGLDEGIDELSWTIEANNEPLDSSVVHFGLPEDIADHPELGQWKGQIVIDWSDTLLAILGPDIRIKATAKDRAGNEVETRWEYSLIDDSEGPEIFRGSTYPGEPQWPGEDPDPLEDRVSLLPLIGCKLFDNVSVDSTSIEMRLDFTRVYADSVFRDTLPLPLSGDDVLMLAGGEQAQVEHQLRPSFFLQDSTEWSEADPFFDPDSMRTRLAEGDTVTILAFAKDSNGRPLQNPTSWQFVTIYDDVTPPYIAFPDSGLTDPRNGEENVEPEDEVVLQINDDEAGLFVYSYKEFCPTCETPRQADQVLSDAEKDQLWPRVYRAVHIGEGSVRIENVTLQVEGVPADEDTTSWSAWNLDCINGVIDKSGGYRCAVWTYRPEPDFAWGDTVEFFVEALDQEGNSIPSDQHRWWFVTPEDDEPPIVCESGPTGSPQSTQPEIFFDVRDADAGNGSGIDWASTVLEAFHISADEWREPTAADWSQIDDWTLEAVVDPEGCPGGQSVHWIPSELDAFTHGDSVLVRFQVADLAGNEMVNPATVTFRADRDAIGPAIVIELRRGVDLLGRSSTWGEGRIPQPGYPDVEAGVINGESLEFAVILKEEWGPDTGLDPSSINVQLQIDNDVEALVREGAPVVGGVLSFADPDTTPSPPGLSKVIYELVVSDAYAFPSGQVIVMTVRADDMEVDGKNSTEGSLTFVVGIEDDNLPIPRVITPNGSTSRFTNVTFSAGPGATTVLKIFNVMGERVASVATEPIGEKVPFVWWGTGGDGKEGGVVVPGGIYIYQYDAGDRVYSGTIGVLR